MPSKPTFSTGRAPPRPSGSWTPAQLAAQGMQMKITQALRDPSRAIMALDKELCEASLIEYAEVMWDIIEPKRPFTRGWAIEAIAEHLEAVHYGQIQKLLVNVPPGMMKSLLTNVFFPSWEWGPRNRPDLRYISASYSENLTIRDNRRGRMLIDAPRWQSMWGEKIVWDKSQDSKTRYDNMERGFRIATSVGGLGTGERGDRFIIDDPHNVKTAESDADLEDKAQWFTEVVPSRVNDLEKSAFIVIMQRVHERDVSGIILAEDLGYTHLELTMEMELHRRCHTVVLWHPPGAKSSDPKVPFRDPREVEGELLFPDRFTRKGVDSLKKSLSSWGGDYAIAGQLQQRPAPRGGGMFKVEACGEPIDFVPPGARRVRGWDIAGSTRKKSPFTAGVKLAELNGIYYVEHVERDRKEIEEAEKLIKDTVIEDGQGVRQSLPQDPGSAGKSQKRHLGVALTGYEFIIDPESGDKVDRAVGIASQWNNGNVKLVRGGWNKAFLNELATFPRGTYKDQVDALSRAYSELLKKREKGVPVGPREITVSDVGDGWQQPSDGDF
jgi:predicted phage terminase large subunit-like protein